ncbi:hypothetical protein CVT25_006129 [Psilocybe cyanescens]|uniref:Nephrocystin 3-like N-terminal domain-containing protein n=1 Tax=Psilocybe cyanescens TaxID=93625 RepID=A0A409WYX3_PSICY|nr:hypothetical protein CVT25_006129 [Psilocybe cyanescens]
MSRNGCFGSTDQQESANLPSPTTKDAVGRGDGTKIVSTIAYQLALKIPSFRALINAAILDNPTLPTKSIDVQLRYLIMEPLLHVTDWPAHSPTIIIDGLDECAGSKRMQSKILSLLSKAIIEHNIPIRFLIVSRPEYWISGSFEIGSLVHVTKLLSLRDNPDACVDIEKYLREGFKKIYEENIQIMSSTPRPWPPAHIILRFMISASGQFLYVSTVLDFVGASSNFCDPQKQLQILTTPGPHRASAFSGLDKLYATILSSYPRPDTMKRVLGGLLLEFSEKTIQEILGVDSGEIQLVLRALSSLIRISKAEYSEEFRVLEPIFGSPLVEASISFCHLSFQQFLEDESRSGEYAIDRGAIYHEFVCSMLKFGVDILQDSPRAKRTIARIGLSGYHNMLNSFGDVPWWISHDARSIVNSLEEHCESLHTIFARNPSQVAQASHVYWFANALFNFIARPQTLQPEDGPYRHNIPRHLLQSLTHVLNVAQIISAKQIMDRSPRNSATFAYIALHTLDSSCPSRTRSSIKAISQSMNISLDTIIFDLQHLPDLVYLDFDPNARGYLDICTEDRLFSAVHHKVQGYCPENQHVAAWDHRIVSFSAQYFNRIFHSNDDQSSIECRWELVRSADCFLRYSRISDIHSKEYFEDPNKMEIFIIMDTSFWDGLRDKSSLELVLAALGWFNWHVTGPSRDFIADHDSSLPHTMLCAAKRINSDSIPSVFLHIIPPSHDGTYYSIEEKPLDRLDIPSAEFNAHRAYRLINKFHEEVFESEGSSVISPYDWYHHLAAFLFTMLVKNQYAALNPSFEEYSGWKTVTRKYFLPLIECLPYAIPTQQNLNALRALHYVCSKIPPQHQWRPPYGFCSPAIDFLKKYDRSSLSWLEFNLLADWLLGLMTHESRRIFEGVNIYHMPDDYTTDDGESSSTMSDIDLDEEL